MLSTPEQKKVLIVDDDEGVRLFVRSVMEQQGWRIYEAANGEEALDRAPSLQPHLIILDLGMPVLNGFETFQRLRTGHTTKHIPVIMLTGIDQERGFHYTAEDMETAFGVPRPEGYVEKPVDPKFLIDCVFGVVG